MVSRFKTVDFFPYFNDFPRELMSQDVRKPWYH
jgi:hypothetical protein